MLGTRWVRFTRRNQVKSIPIQKLRTANALWFVLEKNTKMSDRNFKMSDRNFWGWQREFTVLKRFSHCY
jgi:hypothetical protein